jgi:hypothetical protein
VILVPSGRPAEIGALRAIWIVERTLGRRFPFRVSIEQAGRLVAAFRIHGRWPGPGQQIFCLRELDFDPVESLEEVERVPVAHLSRVGRKLANFWTERFFQAVLARRASPTLELPLAMAARYNAAERGPGLDEEIRAAALREMPSPFRGAARSAILWDTGEAGPARGGPAQAR